MFFPNRIAEKWFPGRIGSAASAGIRSFHSVSGKVFVPYGPENADGAGGIKRSRVER